MNKIIFIFICSILLLVGIFIFFIDEKNKANVSQSTGDIVAQNDSNPFFILSLRNRDYPGSDIKIEETLENGVNYKRYIASYYSDGLKIFGLLTVPNDALNKQTPAIIFLHGYLPPKEYETTARYVQYQDAFARQGYVTFKPDFRGHGKSEGKAVDSNFSEAYVVDTLNAMSSVSRMKEVDPKKIGMWGHSNGGNLTLRAVVVSKKIKAAVIWAGVVGSYSDLLEKYRAKIPWMNNRDSVYDKTATSTVNMLVDKYKTPSENPKFWSLVDPYTYISDISAPIQLHHGKLDESVPFEFSEHLYDALKKQKKTVELFTYATSDHNISQDYSLAMERSVEFFDRYLK